MYLNVHSYFSLKYGTLSPEQLVMAAKRMGIKALVLTDINNTSCAYEFISCCKKYGVKPILGIEFRKENRLLYIGIAKNEQGFFELNRFLTEHSLEEKSLPETVPEMRHVYIIYAQEVKPIAAFRDYEYLGIRPKEVNRLFKSPLLKYQNRLVIFSPFTFLDREGFRTHKLLRAIDLNIVITKLKEENHARSEEIFYEETVLLKHFENYPRLIENTKRIIDNCSIDLKNGFENNRQTFTGSKESDFKLLSKLAINGYKRRYDEKNKEAAERVQRELKVIDEMKFAPYFLITWDIVRYAQSAGYHHIGRGSGANSIVAFCLFITDVDPLELDLYFERFINPHRTSPPDFDIDFSWDERDDVTDYIFKRYGKEYTALLATYNTFKGKSIIRELGKVFGLPKAEIDIIVNEPLAKEKHHALAKHIFRFGKLIEGFPNYLSIHAGGVLISEKPLNYFTALQLMPKGFPITHFDMYGAEDLGFHKYDILSQRGLGHIKETVELVKRNQGKAIDIHDVTKIKQDQKVREQLRSGQCIGCFYVESPAMRGLLSKLKCDNYIHLVAASSIIRPGVAKSGMMREYINRFHSPNSFSYIHPIFEKQLGETFGVMVYQEDVLKICHHFAGLDLGESDVLRRIMTGKKKSSEEFARLRDKYFKNCRKRGYSEKLTEEVWRQIESFSGYSFCKAHSASYAVESFQSLYLKTYFPLEFMVGVINNFGGFYYAELYIHEARMQGARIHAPCANHSFYLTTIEGKDIYLGFIHLHQMERKVVHQIVKERALRGVFKTLEDFISRIDVAQEQLDILVRIGALRFTGFNKYELMWEKNAVYNPKNHLAETGQLFSDGYESFELPQLQEGEFDQAFDEIELLGFPLRSPFELIDGKYEGDILARQMMDFVGKRIAILGYFVTKKNVTTVNKRLMNFGTWVDKEGRFFDTTHFPPSLQRYPFRGKGCYLISGIVTLDFDFPSIEVTKMEKLPIVKDGRY
jgi:DNA-directed DNA polymerase III PolC